MTTPGWYRDPEDAHSQRYWDGSTWTDHRQPLQFPMTFPLGGIRGTLIEHGDGTVSYRRTGAVVDTFRVRIADVTGFASGGIVSLTTRRFRIIGGGTELAATDITRGGAELIESWFRAHPDFNSNGRPTGMRAAPSTVVDELAKLAALKEAGHLTDEEFAAQKARLLG